MVQDGVVILDFGSQYTQLIARRCRELGVYSEILAFDTSIENLKTRRPKAIVLSGGPSSVDAPGAPLRDVRPLLELAPVLGICYGMQLLAQQLGGRVERAEAREYGYNKVSWQETLGLWPESFQQKVWMSHGDVIAEPPQGARVVAWSANRHPAALVADRYWAVQFHPEVAHTERGHEYLRHFLFAHCGAQVNWTSQKIEEHLLHDIREKVGAERDLCALSGGVD